MAKRTYEETAEQIYGASHSIEGLSRKKSKKSKNRDAPIQNGDVAIATPVASEHNDVKEDNKSKKKDKKPKEPDSEPAAASPEVDDEDAAKAAKRARKEARRARKAAKEANENGESVEKGTNVSSQDDGAAEAARTAERKAEKAKLKVAKKSKKDKKSEIENGLEEDTAVTPHDSVLPSKNVSSTSSVEPPSGRYVEDPKLTKLSQSTIDDYLSSKQILVTDPLPKTTYRPITEFSYLPIKDESQLAPFAKFDAPTPIQAAAWPCLLAGRDVIGVAETGSGKTLGFGVPCIQAILAASSSKKVKGVRSLMISPTRELASQIHEQIVQIARPAGLHAACIYGGVPKDPQYEAMKKANIVVATPGRLNDLISEGVVDLGAVHYLVLDEADRMLEKGFEEEIRKIIGQTPVTGRQTLMFTATWPPSVRDLALTFMQNPIKITIGDNHTGELRANTRIEQVVEVVEPHAKQGRLLQLLKTHQSGKKKDDRILVFCLYKKEATRIEQFIRSKGHKVAGIHGDLSQVQRTASLESFKRGETPLLVATDVAARGLDIPAVKVVINVTFPLTAEDYVHRIGRTGRAGSDGLAITLFTEHDKALSGALINVLKAANQPVPDELLKFGGTVKKKAHDAYGAFYKDTGDMKKATKITFD